MDKITIRQLFTVMEKLVDSDYARCSLIGMREGTFIPLYFLDWILSAEILPKLSKLFGGENLRQTG